MIGSVDYRLVERKNDELRQFTFPSQKSPTYFDLSSGRLAPTKTNHPDAAVHARVDSNKPFSGNSTSGWGADLHSQTKDKHGVTWQINYFVPYRTPGTKSFLGMGRRVFHERSLVR